MSRLRVRSIARAVAVGALCPVAASASIFVGISVVMSIAYLNARGTPSDETLARAAAASRFLQRCGPILTALYATAAAFRVRERIAPRSLTIGVTATILGIGVGLAIGEPNWTAGAAFAATLLPTIGAVLGGSLAALREHRRGERMRAVAALEAATWRHEVFAVVLGLAGVEAVARISIVDVGSEPRVLAAWPEGQSEIRAGGLASKGVVVFPSSARGGGKVVLAIELAEAATRLAHSATIAAVADDVVLAHARVVRLERARDAALERERRRVADTVHDTLAQDLTHTVRALEAAQRRLPAADPALFGALESARRGLAGARSLIASSSSGLAPSATSPGASLATRVRAAVADVARGLDADVRVRVEGSPAPLGDDAELLLVRAAREGVNNAKKHARAKRIVVTLTYAGDVARLDVRDDGVGFATDVMTTVRAPGEHVGLSSLRDAARALGASLDLESEPGVGVSLAVEVPRPDAARVA